MYFKGDIIITDPCYIMRTDESYLDIKNKPKWEDYFAYNYNEDPVLFTEQRKSMDIADKEWKKNNIDDWEACDYGDNMESLGIKTYLTRGTEYGDWSCHTFNSDTKEPIGQFCADAGLVSVFLLEEVLKYNPSFNYHIEKPWTTTLIKDFDGEVNIEYFKELDEVRVVGKGNINFITKQTGF